MPAMLAAGSIAPSDKVKVTLRVLMTPEGKLAAEPILIEASASTKGPALTQGHHCAPGLSALRDVAGGPIW